MAQAAPQSMSLVMGDYLSSNDVLTASKFHRVIHHINDYSIMNTRKNLTLLYMFLIITFMGVNLGLLGTNFKSQNFIEENYYVPFHVLEFWAVFAFTITEAFLLVVTESLNWGSKLRCLLVFVNILGSLTAALIMSMDPEVYEVSHVLLGNIIMNQYVYQSHILLTRFSDGCSLGGICHANIYYFRRLRLCA